MDAPAEAERPGFLGDWQAQFRITDLFSDFCVDCIWNDQGYNINI
jgi:hypothetical protein